ncbi:8606_t:CDS:2 [Ambispora gerdemannii]|uniref:Protein-S-isoprenylcysteine O-methyltransferase n=1 Tax=Ambispora gerdemannii TaxID=144530 RepID=A0A9N8YNG6_9GLOM|nr:8606_t:CDS:2 [Ambispora gerdemannii]
MALQSPTQINKEILRKEGVLLLYLPLLGQTCVIFSASLYIYFLIHYYYNNIINKTTPKNNNLLRITSFDVIFYLLSIFGAIWRIKCFKTLEEFFTYHLTIHKEHRLITTGPYKNLRHPSYSAAILMG